jgi:hypothetical protein
MRPIDGDGTSQRKKAPPWVAGPSSKDRRRPTLPHGLPCSTISAERLNCRVRNGNGCVPLAKAAGMSYSWPRSSAGTPPRGRLRPRTTEVSVSLPFLSQEEDGQASRAISTAQLKALLPLHLRPINVVVYHGPSGGLRRGTPGLEVGFPLRCFQRLSRPHIATLRCGWRHNRHTSGVSDPVLSY